MKKHKHFFFTLILVVFGLTNCWSQIVDVGTYVVTKTAQPQNAKKPINLRGHQHNTILSHNGYQYAVFYTINGNNQKNRFVNIGRRKLPNGAWEVIKFDDYTQKANDSHNVISFGICEGDGTIHMIFDQHNGSVPFNYRTSVKGLTTNPQDHRWVAAKFGDVLKVLPGTKKNTNANKNFTYPRFVNVPNGNLQLIRRHGSAVSGASHIYTYSKDSREWKHHGEFINGRAVAYTKPDTGAKTKLGPYLNGANYHNGRLHVSWIWRTTGTTSNNNFDFMYAYSDDYGLTWKNNLGEIAGRAGKPMTYKNPVPVKVLDFPEGIGLTNQTGQTVDKDGRVHVYQTRNASKGRRIAHLYRDVNGKWINNQTDIRSQRGKITHDSNDNIYAIHRSGAIYKATAAENFTDWVAIRANNTYAGEALYDEKRMETDNVISMLVASPGASKDMYSVDLKIKETLLSIDNHQVVDVALYPNPSTSGVFNLRTKQSWSVFDILGARIKEGEGFIIDLADQAKGLYLLKMDTSSESYKLIKN